MPDEPTPTPAADPAAQPASPPTAEPAAPPAPAPPPAQANVFEMSLQGDAVPDKFQGKTVNDLLASYKSLQSQYSKTQQRVADAAKDPSANPINPYNVFREGMMEAIENGGQWNEYRLQELANLGANPAEVQMMTQAVAELRQRAYDRISARLVEDPDVGAQIDVKALFDAAAQSGRYTEKDIAWFEESLQRGALDPVKQMIKDFQEAGVDPRQLQQQQQPRPGVFAPRQPTQAPPGAPNPQRGFLTPGPELVGFGSRQEMVQAQMEAIAKRDAGDMNAWNDFQARLQRSNVRQWTDKRLA